MCKEAKVLKAFALSRQRAYTLKKCFDVGKAEAVTKIIKVTGYFEKATATGWIYQIKEDILTILPSEDSRFKSMRWRS